MSQDKLLYSYHDSDSGRANVYAFDVRFDVYGNPNNEGGSVGSGGHGKFNGGVYNFPGQHVVVSADPDGDGILTQVADLVCTGTGKVSVVTDAAGDVVTQTVQYDGWNLIADPSWMGDPGAAWYKVAVGHFSWTGDAAGNTVVPLHGSGTLTDLTDYIFA